MVDLEVVVKEFFEFLILIVQLGSLVNQLLTVLQEVVVFGQGLVQYLPDPEGALG